MLAAAVLATTLRIAAADPTATAPATTTATTTAPATPAFPPDQDVALPGLVDVGAKLPIHVELKYGTTDNFMKRDVNGGLKRCFLVEDAVKMLGNALDIVHKRDRSE